MESYPYPESWNANDWIPISRKEVESRGWDQLDVILFSGDAYIDHPSFGAAVIARVLEKEGLKVALVPQPNWKDDLRDFTKLGKPRLFFGVTAGNMDSMVNHYTANRRLRSNDAYTPGDRAGQRPDRAVTVYASILRKLYPDVPVIAGGIEASLRRLAHYDYWNDEVMPSLLAGGMIDLILYGNAEPVVVELARLMRTNAPWSEICNLSQVAYLAKEPPPPWRDPAVETVMLHSFEKAKSSKSAHAENFRIIEEESNKILANRLVEPVGDAWVVVNPPLPPPAPGAIDAWYDLPYTRLPHPRYWKKPPIPAFEMIRFSVTLHRGCFGGCAFCTISMHQGKHIADRSEASVVSEVEKVTRMPGFKGYLSDLGGPSANMYGMRPRNIKACLRCKRPSCIHPEICKNLNVSHTALLKLYRRVRSIPGIKKAFVSSGVRYDLFIPESAPINEEQKAYAEELFLHHISGRIKVAPEHTRAGVLSIIRKPEFGRFHKFKQLFDQYNKKHGLRQQVIPYFISAHPGSREEDMAELAAETMEMKLEMDQVQDFTPTPMTLSTTLFHCQSDPYTGKKIFVARTPEEKTRQKSYFFYRKPEERKQLVKRLQAIGRHDLARRFR